MVHRRERSPIGPDAPTIRMNLDTLYSVGVYNNDGYTPFFSTEPGTHSVKHDSEYLLHDSEYLFIAVRVENLNRIL